MKRILKTKLAPLRSLYHNLRSHKKSYFPCQVIKCSRAVKKTLFRAYCMPMYACQLWSKYTHASMKRLRAAYDNAYRIMHYIPRNVSVRPHQVSHCVTTFDALLRNNLYPFSQRCGSSSNFFIRSFQMSDAFHKPLFFLNYLTLMYDGDQLI